MYNNVNFCHQVQKKCNFDDLSDFIDMKLTSIIYTYHYEL